MDPFVYQQQHPQQQHSTRSSPAGLAVGTICEFFVPKVETITSIPPENSPRLSSSSSSYHPLHSSSSLKSSYSIHSNPPSPLYEEEYPQNSPTFFVDAYNKIRGISGELYQCAGDTLSRGYSTDPGKVEYLATELLKIARQINNSADDDDRKRLPPPLVRPRRIRRKHIDEEQQQLQLQQQHQHQQQQEISLVDSQDGEKKRKLSVGSAVGVINPATPELYCHSCGTTDTPEWRRGPDGCKSLCNACGLHYAKILRRETMIPNRQPARQTMTLNNLLN